MRRAGALSVVNSPNSARADFGSITSFVNTGQSVRLAGGATKGRVRPIRTAQEIDLAPKTCRSNCTSAFSETSRSSVCFREIVTFRKRPIAVIQDVDFRRLWLVAIGEKPTSGTRQLSVLARQKMRP
jgi:hypothetical protein